MFRQEQTNDSVSGVIKDGWSVDESVCKRLESILLGSQCAQWSVSANVSLDRRTALTNAGMKLQGGQQA